MRRAGSLEFLQGSRRRKLKRGSLLAWQQMRVARQRESGRVVAEGPAELEKVGAAPEMERGKGMAERLEAGPGRSCLPHKRLEDAWPQVGRVERGLRTAMRTPRRTS
jgi:hypothetical protein